MTNTNHAATTENTTDQTADELVERPGIDLSEDEQDEDRPGIDLSEDDEVTERPGVDLSE